jgi:hypothetical protein
MRRSRTLLAVMGCLAGGVLAPVPSAAATPAAPTFQPRIGGALGLVPPVNRQGRLSTGDVASGALIPVTYHGGPVMSAGVTVHTIFWAPSGYAFQGSPGAGIPTYTALIQQFFTDVAADTGSPGTCTSSDCNVFTVERQYAAGTTPGGISAGSYSIGYSAAGDSIDASDPYPGKADQCASPSGAAVCVTDAELQAEVDRVIERTGGSRGLGNLWFVFLPPGVDECIDPNSCGTNSFAGYHSVSDLNGHAPTVYAVAIDPIIEAPVGSGADPEGYPDAEVTLDVAAHEVNEAVTDPEGSGWMDPNGFEVADKCDRGPQIGTPLGFAPDGALYDQVINGHRYLLQEEWANVDSAGNDDCVQASQTTTNQLPLPQVNLRQFNSVVSGTVNRSGAGGTRVQVSLLRTNSDGNPVLVARAATVTAGDGSWQLSLAPHAVGDDRDEIAVDYSGARAPQPAHQEILTGNGGNPFTESGWTGWTAMDEGSAAKSSSVSFAPCFQAGTLSFTAAGASPNELCNTQTDVATVNTGSIQRSDTIKWTSNDNRAFDAPSSPAPNLLGGLVSLTATVGEPGSVGAFPSPLTTFKPGGFPSCIADLEFQEVGCTGLVPGRGYFLRDGRERIADAADPSGTIIDPLFVRGGDVVSLSNGSRTLTTLHVAHLRARIVGEETFLSGGRCQPGDYFAPPLSAPPTTTAAGMATDPTKPLTGGAALTGAICPLSGRAGGLPSTNIVQTDELSGGMTETEVPDIQNTSPMEGETMYGRFTALAESGFVLTDNELLPADVVTRIGLRIVTPRGATVWRISNVDTEHGAGVPALVPGSYRAIWTLTDVNGDTRVLVTRFVEQRGRSRPGPRAGVSCHSARGSAIRCTVGFANGQVRGQIRMRLSRAGTLVALGHGTVRDGRAVIGMSKLASPRLGRWRATIVFSAAHVEPVTIQAAVRGL